MWAAGKKVSPSYRNSVANLAPQMRVAFSSMVSNTGSSSPGELLIMRKTSEVAVCCSNASESWRVRASVASALGQIGGGSEAPCVVEGLLGRLEAESEAVCASASRALGEIGSGADTLRTAEALLKLLLYISRPRLAGRRGRLLLPLLRVGVGLLLPAALWLTGMRDDRPWLMAAGLVGELVDRGEFYAGLDTRRPERQVREDLQERLA